MQARDANGPRRRPLGRLLLPAQEFIATQAAGGVALFAGALVGLAWANSPWSERYVELFEAALVVDVGFYRAEESLRHWINDAAMAWFFLLVGLEIKRELVLGELRSLRRAALPAAAAAGGMVVPALIFVLIAPADARHGWGVPIATDIAFALGVAALAGSRVGDGLKVLLLAIAIFDDIGAVGVIALFYAKDVDLAPLALAVVLLCGVWAIARARVRSLAVYVAVGGLAWVAALKSGVHPTIVGVALGLITPARAHVTAGEFAGEADAMLDDLRRPELGEAPAPGALDPEALLRLRRLSERALPPLDQLEHGLHRWVAFGVVPLFALANTGVDLRGDALGDALGSGLAWGVAVGLLLGKPLGIVVAAWLAVRAGAELPSGVRWRGVVGIGLLAGMGFTVALFVAELAFTDGAQLAAAKLGIFGASLASGLAGYALLRTRGASGGEQEARAG
ncbi:MAG: Na+/H+ antiporter NhaA [Chloroflexi bacterium]|nr:Na+/H+ antiporter NhaA [Chloroflexota bacterium]